MAFPAAHLLIGCGVGELASASLGLPRRRAWALGGMLATIPDVDLLLPVRHGTWTHSMLAVAVVTLAACVLAGPRWGTLALAAYGSHALLNLLDDRGPTKVFHAWPFSDGRYVQCANVTGAARSVTLRTPAAPVDVAAWRSP